MSTEAIEDAMPKKALDVGANEGRRNDYYEIENRTNERRTSSQA